MTGVAAADQAVTDECMYGNKIDLVGMILTNRSGWTACDNRRNLVAIDNVGDGFSLHRADTVECLRNFPTGTPTRRVCKQVVFGEDGKVIIGGSDHGSVYIFDRKTGTPIEVLRHALKGLVQAVAVSILNTLPTSMS